MEARLEDIKEIGEKIIRNVEKVIIGKREIIKLVLIGILCDGHILIEDVPGVGKTMLAKSIAKSIGCTFRRIQFTPDLLPSDVLGVTIFNQKTLEFEFRPGPIMSQTILADEINRGTPKTQSSLLECMEERQITLDGITREVPRPFLVIATQNPIEYYGTFPLPEAQVDRFLLKIKIGYPSQKDEEDILVRQQLSHPIDSINPVITSDELISLQSKIREVYVEDSLRNYIVNIINCTRQDERVFLGASPRGSLGLFRTAQAKAALDGRDYVLPDDIKDLVIPVLRHRLILKVSSSEGSIEEDILSMIISKVPVPI